MAPTKKRKTTRKSVATTKPVKARRTAGKRGAGERRKSLVMDVVHQLEHKLEEIPGKLRKTARETKTKTAAARSRVVQKVVNTIEEGTKSLRKAAKKTTTTKAKTTTKKKARRV